MLRPARQEVPSLELGPPSPSWMEMDALLAAKPEPLAASRPDSLSARYESTWMSLSSAKVEPARSRSDRCESQSGAFLAATKSDAGAATSASATTSAPRATKSAVLGARPATGALPVSARQRSAQRREARRLAAWTAWGEELIVDDAEEAPLASAALAMERDVTEEFLNEFWGDLALDPAPGPDDLLDIAEPFGAAPAAPATEPAEPAPAPAPAPVAATELSEHIADLMESLTDDQLMELTASLESEKDALPPLEAAAPAASAETCGVSTSTIDLAALLEETEIVFEPEPETAPTETAVEIPSPVLPVPSPALPVPSPAATVSPSPALPVPSPAVPVPSPAASVPTPAGSLPSPAASLPSPPAPLVPAPVHYVLVLPAASAVVTAPAAAAVTASRAVTARTATPAARLPLPSSSRASSASAEDESDADEPPPRKRRAPAPAATPAEKYRRIRDNNNEASRRSRLQRKQREQESQGRLRDLEAENAQLKGRVDVLEGLLERVKALAPLLTARGAAQ